VTSSKRKFLRLEKKREIKIERKRPAEMSLYSVLYFPEFIREDA
jgi:hypothetical protein